MSRIGKKVIDIPAKAIVKIEGATINVKGPRGSLDYSFSREISVKVENQKLILTPINITNTSKALWGLSRTLISNMIIGVTVGFTKSLEFNGVGYKAVVSGSTLTLNLGYSHPIDYSLPVGIEAKINKNVIEISGSNKELVGFVAAQIRSFREPEPYKGKGIKYTSEKIIRKAGKTGAKK